jgi:hypothetical protein
MMSDISAGKDTGAQNFREITNKAETITNVFSVTNVTAI